ncbi:DUF5674 family protein [bacterium]|nr:DUF5674 family protein [bacterium]
MKIISEKITIEEIRKMAAEMFGNLVKAVVDIEKEIMAIDGELHADEEVLLLENGSDQDNLWGINIYPDLPVNERIEFDSMINLRPRQGNRTRSVDNPDVREKILIIINKLIKDENTA